jgi:hypothetical protein
LAEIGAGLFLRTVSGTCRPHGANRKQFLFNHLGGAMKRKRESNQDENTKKEEVRVELKYCERCGGLWLRECGTGEVYCGNCRAQIADLPIPKKKPQRVGLPVRRSSLVEDCSFNGNDDSLDFEAAAGGVA